MDYFKRRNILIWALIILVVLNISTLVTIWLMNRPAIAPAGPVLPSDMEFRGVNHFIRNELAFTEAQWQQFTGLRQRNMVETRNLMQEMQDLRQDMFDELISKNPNEKKLEKIGREMGETHSALKINSMQFFTEVHKICTSEQKQKLNRLYQELKNMPENRGNGRGDGRQRRGHRWRNERGPQ
ncbi:MAG: Spy/CpxP family protein refolding chaperone [Bacteroidota bacterium]